MKRLVDDKKQELLDNLLESVSVDNKGNMEVGKNLGVDGTITINSAKDLVTKDGSSLGSNVQRIDITTILSQADILSLVGALTGHLENPSFTFDFTFTNNINNPTADEIDIYLDMSVFGGTGFIDLFFIKSSKQDGIRYASTYTSYAGKLIRCGGMSLTGADNVLTTIYGGGIACADYALKADLNAKQSTLYRHTVLISEPTNKTAYLAFTAESEKNTPIDSIQDLITVFGNTSIACSGLYRDGDPSNEQSLLMINVGTSISNTTIASATLENSIITSFSNALFTDTFDTGLTITDNVTAM